MNENERFVIGEKILDMDSDQFDFDQLEADLESGLEDSLYEWDFLEHDKSKIGNPTELGQTILNVVWDQAILQIGAVAGEDFIKENRGMKLDLSCDAHIQTAENFAKGKIANHNTEIDYKKRYDEWQSNFDRDEYGNIKMHDTRVPELDSHGKPLIGADGNPVMKKVETLVDGYRNPYDKKREELGLKGSREKHTAMDETVSVAEIVRDPALNAFMTEEERVNFDVSDKNLNEIDSSWNSSKGDKATNDWLDNPNKNGQKPSEIFDISPEEDQALRQKDKEAREEKEKRLKEAEEKSNAAGKQSQKAEAYRIGGKALRAAIMGLLAELMRNIISKLVQWIKNEDKNLKTFLGQVKEAISSFVYNIKQNLITAGTTVASTILNAIFGPVVGTIQKIWIMIKQGGKSVKEAIEYVKKPENRTKSYDILFLEVGKILMTGLVGIGGLVLGEIIEKGLSTIPIFAFEIPLLGSLANIIGIFMGAVVAGIAGALVLHMIDAIIAKKRERDLVANQIEMGNEVLAKEAEVRIVNQEKLQRKKEKSNKSITNRHNNAAEEMKDSLDSIISNNENDPFSELMDMIE